jgi:nickel-dependent lactate racemase
MRHGIQFGKRTLSLTVPDERVVGVLAPKPVKELKDINAAVGRALRTPTEPPALRDLLKGKKTALLATVDHTRPSPRRLLLPILEACERESVSASIIIATGRHRKMTQQELLGHLGPDILIAGKQASVLFIDKARRLIVE